MPEQQSPTIRLPLAFVDALSQATGVETVLTVAAQWLPRMLPATRATVALIEDTRLISRVSRTDGHIDLEFEAEEHQANVLRQQVLRDGRTLALHGTQMAQSDLPVVAHLHASGLRRLMIVPMYGGGEAVGTLSIADPEDAVYDDDVVEALIGLGKFVAAQARLMQQARAAARAAETDTLTGLANRKRLMRVLDGPGGLHRPDAQGRVLGVLHIDLDHFKEVNDRLGHAVGDAVLRHAATEMRRVTSDKDVVARVGGDEFVVVTRTDRQGAHIADLADRLVAAVSAPLQLGDVEARIGVSIGTAIATDEDCTGDRLIANADIALYQVKNNGRGGVCMFCDDMRAARERRIQLLSDLHEAVESHGFEPYFQPQIEMQSGRFRGFEMLARWPHPDLGVLEPDDFIALAVEAGLSDRVDEIVRAKGLAALRRLRAAGWDAPRMSFNASARTLGDPDLVESLLWEVLGQGLAPEDLVLEVREADLVELGSDAAIVHINALSEAGFDVELDDFGAGYAAMTNLGRLAISGVKLDPTIIAPLPGGRPETIVRAMIAMAKELQLEVLAEGVATKAQFALLSRIGCDVAQGFDIARPLPFDELVGFIENYGKGVPPLTLPAG